MSVRISPSESATQFEAGTEKRGNDGRLWVVSLTKSKVKRWTPYISTKLNGLQALTLDYLTKNVGKPVRVYDREWNDVWPTSKNEEEMYNYMFIPSGDMKSMKNKTVVKDWLRTRNPPVKRGVLFLILGTVDGKPWSLALDSNGGQLISSNFLSRECFTDASG